MSLLTWMLSPPPLRKVDVPVDVDVDALPSRGGCRCRCSALGRRKGGREGGKQGGPGRLGMLSLGGGREARGSGQA